MGASAFLKSVYFRAFGINVKTIASKKYLYQFGHAIWVYREPMAIRTFLEEYDFSGKTVISFCTSMAVGIKTSMGDIKKLCPEAKVFDGLRLETEQEDFSKQISRWIKKNNNKK